MLLIGLRCAKSPDFEPIYSTNFVMYAPRSGDFGERQAFLFNLTDIFYLPLGVMGILNSLRNISLFELTHFVFLQAVVHI